MTSAQEKTEKPSGKKLSEAKKRGNIAKSREANSTAVLMGSGIALYLSGDLITDHFRLMMVEAWGEGFRTSLSSPPGASLFLSMITHFSLMVFPTLLSAFLVAVGVNLIQTKGFSISLQAIQPNFSKLNPLSGFKKFVSLRSFIELGKSTIKMIIIGSAVYAVFQSEGHLLLPLMDQEVPGILQTLGHLTTKIVTRVCGIMLFVSLLDAYYQRWQHTKDLMMTKQEVKEEAKQSEGNPQIKSRIRSLQRSLARQRMMSKVPKATVVITNPTHYAVALQYEPHMEAPKVVAKGMNLIALNIIKIARKHRIPVVQNPPLARALYSEVELEETVPITLYKAVAKVLAFVFQQQGRRPS